MSSYSEDEISSDSMESAVDSSGDEIEEESSHDSSEYSDEDDIDVWSKIQEEAMKRHDDEYEEMLQKFLANGDDEEVAALKAGNALVPTYRKELRQVLFEELKWIRNLKKDPIYKKINETKTNLVDSEDYDWEEAMQSAINKRKYLLKDFFVLSKLPKQQSKKFHPYSRPYGTFT